MRRILVLFAAAAVAACQPAPESDAPDSRGNSMPDATSRLIDVLGGLPEDVQARYRYRHPLETLTFFGIEPGMTVVEALPGGGWYTKVLAPYLGEDGHIVGAAYALDMYALFSFATDEFMARQRAWAGKFPGDVAEWGGEDGASGSAFHFGSMPDELEATADAVLMIRALHNLARFQAAGEGDYLDAALADAYRVLKPGGVLGVVQHEARPDTPDEWATGAAGYLKKSAVIQAATAAGFELVAESAVNENPDDRPTTDDVVWRLPPSYNGTRDDPDRKAAVDAIGESHRMTLKFVKP